jgi:hypothetical protein
MHTRVRNTHAHTHVRARRFPWPEEYDEGNLLFKRRHAARTPRRGRPPTRAAAQAHAAMGIANLAVGPYDGDRDGDGGGARRAPNGARLKVMRCVHLKNPEQRRPLVDFGVGLSVDLDRQVRGQDRSRGVRLCGRRGGGCLHTRR